MIEIPASMRPRAPAIASQVPALAPAVYDTGRMVWCGPAALSAITGCTAAEIERAVQEARARRGEAKAHQPVVGTSTADVREALSALGWRLSTFWTAGEGRVTFGRWMQGPRLARVHYLVGLMARRRPHWVALKGVMTADTFSDGRWIFAVDGRHMGARLLDVHTVERIAAVASGNGGGP